MTATKPLPPLDYLHQCLKLLPDGTLIRKSTGKPALNTKNARGYRHGTLNGKKMYAHRVVYALYYGVDPGKKYIDHVNHDPSDNRPKNLRLCTHRENLKNAGKNSRNTSGHSNVHFYKRDMTWQVQLRDGDDRHHIGYFQSLEEAIEARDKAAYRLGFHKNHGR